VRRPATRPRWIVDIGPHLLCSAGDKVAVHRGVGVAAAAFCTVNPQFWRGLLLYAIFALKFPESPPQLFPFGRGGADIGS